MINAEALLARLEAAAPEPLRSWISAEMRRLELWLKDHPEHQDLTIAGQFRDSGGLGIRTPHLVTAP